MAFHIINRPAEQQQPIETPWQSLLRGLGTGVTEHLNAYATNKLNQLKQERELAPVISNFEKLGIPQAEANYLASLPPQQQVGLLQQLAASQQAPQNQLQQSLLPAQQPVGLSAPQNSEQALAQQPMTNSPKAVMKGAKKERATAQLQEVQPQQPEAKSFLAKLSSAPQKTKETQAEQHRVNKETEKIYQQTFKEARAASESNKRLKRMEELVRKGNLPSAGWGTALKSISKGVFGFGVDLYNLTHADSQEFEKLSKDFIKNAKDIFGSRVTNYDLENFLRTVPDLSQTNEGKLRLVNNLRGANEASLIRKQVMEDIIAANGGKRPENLEGLIEEFAGPRLNVLAEQFKESGIEPAAEAEFGQLMGKRPKKQTLSEEIQAFRQDPRLSRLFFQRP